MPQDWKCANIIPVFRKKAKSAANTYWPISLTSQVVKVLESVVCDNILKFFSSLSKLTWCSLKKSWLTNLLESYHDLIQLADNGSAVDIVFLDHKKAYDSVPHKKLICKLKDYWIPGNLLLWLMDLLHQRTQKITVEGTNSNWCRVISGVPQDSILGPLLFIIYNQKALITLCR